MCSKGENPLCERPSPFLPSDTQFNPHTVDADGQISVLNGDRKHTSVIDATPAGIS